MVVSAKQFLLKLAIAHSIFLSPSNSIFANAGLCEDNADICQLHQGSYTDHDNNSRQWWAFEPKGQYACPPDGCPLYVWIDGTNQAPYQAMPDQFYMMEMLKRGFIAATVEYDAATGDYSAGCYGSWLDWRGFDDKAQEIFDGDVADSVVSQVCASLANCDKGIATHGWSQGAHIAGLAGNHEPRVSAALLFGNGNDNSVPLSGDISCMTSDQLSLPRERRRSITGESDDYFGVDYSGVLRQQIETSGYDCRRDRGGFVDGDHWNCFTKLPEGCNYAFGEQYCPEFDRYFTLNCAACNLEPPEPCPSELGLKTNACPVEVPDTYIGGGATIEDTAGYYVISNEEYCSFIGSSCVEAPHGFFQNFDPSSDFMNPGVVWGLPQNLDWLARIAKITSYNPPSTSSTTTTTSTTTTKTTTTEEPATTTEQPTTTTTATTTTTTATTTTTTATTTTTTSTSSTSYCSTLTSSRKCSRAGCTWTGTRKNGTCS